MAEQPPQHAEPRFRMDDDVMSVCQHSNGVAFEGARRACGIVGCDCKPRVYVALAAVEDALRQYGAEQHKPYAASLHIAAIRRWATAVPGSTHEPQTGAPAHENRRGADV